MLHGLAGCNTDRFRFVKVLFRDDHNGAAYLGGLPGFAKIVAVVMPAARLLSRMGGYFLFLVKLHMLLTALFCIESGTA